MAELKVGETSALHEGQVHADEVTAPISKPPLETIASEENNSSGNPQTQSQSVPSTIQAEQVLKEVVAQESPPIPESTQTAAAPTTTTVAEQVSPEDPLSSIPRPIPVPVPVSTQAAAPALQDGNPVAQNAHSSDTTAPTAAPKVPQEVMPEDSSDDDSLSLTESEFQATKHLSISADGLQTSVNLTDHGLDIEINEKMSHLTNLLKPAFEPHDDHSIPQIPEYLAHAATDKYPRLNIVIQIVGSRGDVQPFVSLGKVLKEKYGHRVRIATHLIFKPFVEENDLEFFNIGGDPAELMAFMVHNPGLIPDVATLRSGEVSKRRKGTHEMLVGCWRSCIESGDGTGPPIFESKRHKDDGMPFIADAIIANPPSFAHIHCAEKLGIPLHLMFTMPWSPTRSFPHPLANINSSNADAAQTNFISYALVEMMTWQGLGDVINKFRRTILNLQNISLMWAPGLNSRLRIPFTYCWSPALIPKPKDWGPYISISGFYFLSLASSFTPAPELLNFLAAGPPPVYIGFGSIVVDDPDAMTAMIFSAVKKLGIRALVSKGWGGLGGDALEIPDNIFMLGNVPHDWLFQHVSAVVHHGGAGTTAAGIAAGRPTVVVPFFGDQPFWGAMIARAGAGPPPIPFKQLNVDNLVTQLAFALKPETLVKAKVLGERMARENGAVEGSKLFHAQLESEVQCSILPERVAVWRVKKTDVRLSGLVATVLINRGLVDLKDLKIHRPREYQLEDGPWDPVSGVASTLIGTLGSLAMGVADLPTDFYHTLKAQIDKNKSSGSLLDLGPNSSRNSIEQAYLSDMLKNEDMSTTSLPITGNHTTKTEQIEKEKPNDDSTLSLPIEHQDGTDLAVKAPVMNSESAATSTTQFMPSTPSRASTILDQSDPTSPLSPKELFKNRPNHFTRSTAHAAEFLLKSPLDLFSSLAGGFHNAPKLYGDTTVRTASPISGFQSGLKAAGKDLALGVFDGVTGLITQPVQGAKEQGVPGLLLGVAKGVGGLVLKPVGAVTGVPASLLRGVYKELEKGADFCLQTHIVLSRVAQGLAEVEAEGGRRDAEIVEKWSDAMREADLKRNDVQWAITGKTHTHSHGLHFKSARHMTFNEAALHAEEKGLRRKSVSAPALVPPPLPAKPTDSNQIGEQDEYGSDLASDQSSIISSEDDNIVPKMEVRLGNGKVVKRHMTVRDVVERLKQERLKHERLKHERLGHGHHFSRRANDVEAVAS